LRLAFPESQQVSVTSTFLGMAASGEADGAYRSGITPSRAVDSNSMPQLTLIMSVKGEKVHLFEDCQHLKGRKTRDSSPVVPLEEGEICKTCKRRVCLNMNWNDLVYFLENFYLDGITTSVKRRHALACPLRDVLQAIDSDRALYIRLPTLMELLHTERHLQDCARDYGRRAIHGLVRFLDGKMRVDETLREACATQEDTVNLQTVAANLLTRFAWRNWMNQCILQFEGVIPAAVSMLDGRLDAESFGEERSEQKVSSEEPSKDRTKEGNRARQTSAESTSFERRQEAALDLLTVLALGNRPNQDRIVEVSGIAAKIGCLLRANSSSLVSKTVSALTIWVDKVTKFKEVFACIIGSLLRHLTNGADLKLRMNVAGLLTVLLVDVKENRRQFHDVGGVENIIKLVERAEEPMELRIAMVNILIAFTVGNEDRAHLLPFAAEKIREELLGNDDPVFHERAEALFRDVDHWSVATGEDKVVEAEVPLLAAGEPDDDDNGREEELHTTLPTIRRRLWHITRT